MVLDRIEFRDLLGASLLKERYVLVSAELGRQGGYPFWLVTMNGPLGIARYKASFEKSAKHYSHDTLEQLTHRLLNAARSEE